MQTRQANPVNPFALMLDPQAVIAAVEKSGCLDHLKRRVCRPLDKPLIPKRSSAELAAFDSSIDDDADDEADLGIDGLDDQGLADAVHEAEIDLDR
jgi:hypothetical protein